LKRNSAIVKFHPELGQRKSWNLTSTASGFRAQDLAAGNGIFVRADRAPDISNTLAVSLSSSQALTSHLWQTHASVTPRQAVHKEKLIVRLKSDPQDELSDKLVHIFCNRGREAIMFCALEKVGGHVSRTRTAQFA
jgi:hypothetical protein